MHSRIMRRACTHSRIGDLGACPGSALVGPRPRRGTYALYLDLASRLIRRRACRQHVRLLVVNGRTRGRAGKQPVKMPPNGGIRAVHSRFGGPQRVHLWRSSGLARITRVQWTSRSATTKNPWPRRRSTITRRVQSSKGKNRQHAAMKWPPKILP